MKIVGSKGYADSLIGYATADQIYGDSGNDLISAWSNVGEAAKDKVWAGDGNDLISGFSFNLSGLAQSGSRGAFVDGGSGYDMLILDMQSSSRATELDKLDIVSNIVRVEEIIYNFSDATQKQRFVGTDAGETIYIGESGSTVDGGNGNDNLFGGSGEDTLVGGAGNDLLSAAGGRNTLTGGKGADYFQFHLTEDYSYSNITDFQKGVDKIALVLDTGGEFSSGAFGDGLRPIDREMDAMGYLDYDNGRVMNRALFANNATYYADNMRYEQSTGDFLQHVYIDDGAGGTLEYDVLLAHLENKPNLDASDFVFYVL
jgi:Ca2+-binding RTX toxin-like protein